MGEIRTYNQVDQEAANLGFFDIRGHGIPNVSSFYITTYHTWHVVWMYQDGVSIAAGIMRFSEDSWAIHPPRPATSVDPESLQPRYPSFAAALVAFKLGAYDQRTKWEVEAANSA